MSIAQLQNAPYLNMNVASCTPAVTPFATGNIVLAGGAVATQNWNTWISNNMVYIQIKVPSTLATAGQAGITVANALPMALRPTSVANAVGYATSATVADSQPFNVTINTAGVIAGTLNAVATATNYTINCVVAYPLL